MPIDTAPITVQVIKENKKPVTIYGWRPGQWAEATGLSRATVYNLLAEEKIDSVKNAKTRFGARIIITHPLEYLKSLKEGEEL